MSISRIEVDFAVPVELTDKEMRQIHQIVDAACRRTETDSMVHWAAGCGHKPQFSKADCLFLGKESDPNAPDSGEPTFDSSVFYIETCARERYESERRDPPTQSGSEGGK